MRHCFTLVLICFSFIQVFSQKTYKVNGMITDTLDNSLISATVLLLEKSDSTMVKFTRTELDGSFVIKNIEPGNYLIKATYIGYLPKHIPLKITNSNRTLKTIEMSEIASELMEVVIKAAKAPMIIRGDTIEYDASTFRVPEGSTVEDLLKRLPGIEVGSDGSIKSEGRDITKVTVDGKNFFGSDPKAATKNLPAEGISKVTVFDKKTEESKITGNNTNTDEKTMDLQLKDDFKSGGFGRIVGGIGTKERAELKGNYNKFNDKIQFSLVGVGNNTGRNGLGWDDYQDFLGSQSFQFDDDGVYGFTSMGYTIYFGGNSSNSLESDVQSLFFGRGNTGLPKNYNGGINFNYDHKKTKLSSVYFYNWAFLNQEMLRKSTKLQNTFQINEDSDRITLNTSQGHRAETRFEQEIDSFHTVVAKLKGAYIDNVEKVKNNLSLKKDNQIKTKSSINNTSNQKGYLGNAMIVLRKKFRKKGRRIGANSSFLKSNLTTKSNQSSNLEFLEENKKENIKRHNDENRTKSMVRGNVIYVEPLPRKLFNEVFYNYSYSEENGDISVQESLNENDFQPNNNLSRLYNNHQLNHRVGNSLRYSHKGINISLGVAYQQINLKGNYKYLNTQQEIGKVNKTFRSIIPNLSIRYSPNRSFSMNMSYTNNISTPSIDQIIPVVDNSNPLFIREGNINLEPTSTHSIRLRGYKSYLASGIRIRANVTLNAYSNSIINEEIIDNNLITYIKPINYTGGFNSYGYSNLSFPLMNNKIKISIGYSPYYSQSFAFVNTVLNKTITLRHRPSISLDFSPNDNFGINISTYSSFSNTQYEINTSQNQESMNINLNTELNAKLFWGIYTAINFDYDYYNNTRYNLNQSIPVLNGSIYKHFLPGNKLEIRLSLYDAFNRQLGVSQRATAAGFYETTTNAIGQYMMVSATYNIKGLKNDLQKDGWF